MEPVPGRYAAHRTALRGTVPPGSASGLNCVSGNKAVLPPVAIRTSGTIRSTSQFGTSNRSVVVRLPVSMVWCARESVRILPALPSRMLKDVL